MPNAAPHGRLAASEVSRDESKKCASGPATPWAAPCALCFNRASAGATTRWTGVPIGEGGERGKRDTDRPLLRRPPANATPRRVNKQVGDMGNFVGRAIVAAAFGVTLAIIPANAAAKKTASSNVSQKTGENLKRIGEAYERDDCATVLKLGAPIIDAPDRSGLGDDIAALLFQMLGYCEWKQESKDRAYSHALKGTALDEASDYLWRMRLALEMDLKRDDEAIATIHAMTQGRGAALNSFDVGGMWQFHNHLKNAGKQDLRRRLLQILSSDAYSPDDLFGSNEGFRYAYAEILADAGDSTAARQIIAGLRNASILSKASVDPRFRAFLPASLDFRAAAEAELARDRDAMAIYPNRLAAIVNTAGTLRMLGRPQEAIDLLLAAGPRVADEKEFTDREEYLNWYWDALGRSYEMLGRYDEMVAAFTKGAERKEGSEPNVSQVINLAHAQYGLGRGDEALRTISVFEDGRQSSPYGQMEMHLARGCALAVAGRPADAAPDLAFAREHEKDHPEALADLLLCLGDMDGAAAAFIRRLEDPDRRADALLQLSDYDDPPVTRRPHPIHAGLDVLKKRPDITAAIEKAGGVRRFRLQRGEL